MMEYEIFKEVMKEMLQSYFTGKGQTVEMIDRKVNKVNGVKDGLYICKDGTGNVSPTIYLNDLYRGYLECGDLEKVFQGTVSSLEKAFLEVERFQPFSSKFGDLKKFTDKIVFQLINTEQNKEMLENMPHRAFQDLSIIYRIVLDANKDSLATIPITCGIAEAMELSENELYSLAQKNTEALFPTRIDSMANIMIELLLADGMPEELVEEMTADMKKDQVEMYIISNNVKQNGATGLLYEEKLHEFAEKLGSDMYILPSSIHEVIAIPANGVSPKELADMVRDVNRTQVELEDRLSNQVYQYDRLSRKVTLVTNTPDKRLDHYVAEAPAVYGTEMERAKGR